MMENLLSTSSSMIETTSATSQSERVLPGSDTEFDGEIVLCRVCGDRASGFHYGVHACEGCKGFFRRSIQQKIQYRPCLKNQQCSIQRVNRNRCQYCRLKKCISVGMSRDAVRFGRVPKKEKARIIEQMQKKNLASQSSELNNLLANDLDVVQAVVAAHHQTCDITQFRAHQMRDIALHKQEYINCPANMACPLNNEIGIDSNTNRNNLSDFSESFTPAIKSVVDFAKGIPGFVLLNQDDQVTLLKAGTFEVLLVRLACLFDPHSNTMMFTGGKLFKRPPTTMTTNAGFLLDSMFDFAERFNKMCLTDDEIALFSAVVLLSPDRPGLRNVDQLEKIQNKLTEALQNIVNTNHKEDGTLFAKLLMKTTDLRTLNTLHSEKSIAGQRSNHERRERQNTDDSDMDFQDSLSTRSSRSSPTLSETSNMTMTSGYSGDTDGGSIVIGQRLPLDASGHQVVLRTPYGTFFREDMSGFYGMMTDQPRRRCNTLDRDTLTRPRLHTIEEGNRRRYTLDRDYINKMANRLSDRLETRGTKRGDSLPPSMPNSATSSPIQEEGTSLYHVPSSTSFTPITVPDGIMGHPSAIVTRTSPLAGTEAILAAVRAVSSPGSPKSRSRSGSFTQEDYANMRPRCYSFHLNSEGRAARMSLQRRMLAAEQGQDRDSQISPDSNHYLSAEMRRGSVGATIGPHKHKQPFMVDRALPYIRGRAELDSSSEAESHSVMKHIMPDGSVYGIQLTQDIPTKHSGLWHPQATLSMGMAPPASVTLVQRSREDLTRPMNSRSRGDWDVVNCVTREMSQDILQRELSKNSVNGQSRSPEITSKENLEAQMLKAQNMDMKADKSERSNMISLGAPQSSHFHLVTSAVPSIGTFPERKNSFHDKSPGFVSADSSSTIMETLAPSVRSKAPSPEVGVGSRSSSLRGSPVGEDSSTEVFGHKKFDKFRKEKVQADSTSTTTPREYQVTGGKDTEGLKIKEEKMEEDEGAEEDENELKIDVFDVKTERKSPYVENLSPSISSSSTPSPNSDRPKLSAREAHPNLLAHLMNGGSAVRQVSPRLPPTTTSVSAPTASVPAGFPWMVPSNLASTTNPNLQTQQLFRQPFLASQNTNIAGLLTTSPASLPPPSSSVQAPNPQFTSTADQYSSSVNPYLSSQHNGTVDQRSTTTKDDVHATAVSHLKDKILRKYDSLENLTKVGKDSPTGGSGSNTNPCTPNSSPWSNSPSVQAVLSSTADLNKELATKLTLTSSTLPSGTMPTSTPSSSSTAASSTQRLVYPPFPNQSGCIMSSSSTTAATSQSDPTARFFQRGISHLSHMLMSQENHPASIPMYHSMLSQQYPNLRNSSATSSNHMPSSQSPLANMQHFARMFVQGQTLTADTSEKRLDLNSPLNLTSSKMEEGRILPGSNSPSHNPQTTA